eukprot:COSAG03_NODE_126_length_12149_cov_3.594274_3_plen_118_part_00
MVPPPLWRDSVYGMNQTILNDIMPSLVPEIAALAKLPPPIDLFTALGASHCDCGCRWLLIVAMQQSSSSLLHRAYLMRWSAQRCLAIASCHRWYQKLANHIPDLWLPASKPSTGSGC